MGVADSGEPPTGYRFNAAIIEASRTPHYIEVNESAAIEVERTCIFPAFRAIYLQINGEMNHR